VVIEPQCQCISPRREDAPLPSVGYMVCNVRRVHPPSCQIIYMTIGILLKMRVLDQGGTAAADNDVDNGGLSYSNDDNDDNNNKE
jgi:hypothetical protein